MNTINCENCGREFDIETAQIDSNGLSIDCPWCGWDHPAPIVEVHRRTSTTKKKIQQYYKLWIKSWIGNYQLTKKGE